MKPGRLFFAYWLKDGEWDIRIDGPHLNPPLGKPHVHIWRRRGENGVYSWNVDGSRHDKGNFPKDEKHISKARSIAAERLNIDASLLQLIVRTEGNEFGVVIFESGSREVRHHSFIEIEGEVVILANDEWLIIAEVHPEEPNKQPEPTPPSGVAHQ